MARTAITPTTLAVNASAADAAGTATTGGAGNGVSIAGNIAAPEQTILRVSNATAGAGTVSVKAGSQPSAIASGQGDLTVSVAASGVQWLGPFESARFGQPDGALFADTSIVMTITAFKVNRH